MDSVDKSLVALRDIERRALESCDQQTKTKGHLKNLKTRKTYFRTLERIASCNACQKT